MALVRRENRPVSWDPLSRLGWNIERLFGFPFNEWPERQGAMATDVVEENDKFVVTTELPGLKKEDIEISVEGNTLCICAERKQEQEKRGGDYYQAERHYGRCQRNIMLPQSVDAGKVAAQYKDGLLTITIPKSEQAKRKSIEIKTS